MEKKPPIRKILIPAIITLVAVVFLFSFLRDHVSCAGGFPVFKKSKKEVPQKAPVETPLPVKVYKVARVSFRDALPALGTIKGFREFDLKFAASGTIEYINFKEGERITQGDIIASLDQKEALLKLEYAKIEMEKNSKLLELGALLESKMKQSQLEYQSAKTELDKTNLIAFTDGYIGSLETDKGAYVTPQDKIGTFVDIKDVYVDFGIIEKDIGKVKEGQNIEVVVDTYPDQIFKGQVDSVSPLVEGRSRTVRVRAKISNPDEKLKSGMFGRVNVLVYEKEQALIIPSSSFKKKEDQYFVYLVHVDENAEPEFAAPLPESLGAGKKKKGAPEEAPQPPAQTFGTIEIRPIEVAYATPDAIEIKEGLDEGDTVVVDASQELQDKAKVEIAETQEGIF